MKLDWYKAKGGKFTNVSEKSGVYIISTLQRDDKYEVKYVGIAKDLRKRANEHWSTSESNIDLKNHIAKGYAMKFSYAEVGVQADRENIELHLYNYYDPIYNNNTPFASKETVVNKPDVRKRL